MRERTICERWRIIPRISISYRSWSKLSLLWRHSKLLIADIVIPERGVQAMSGFMDLMMLGIGGKERTKADSDMALDQAGFKVDGIYRAEGARSYAIVECSVK